VDIWHCDATGVYSDVQDPWFNTIGRKFLRGHQITDARGEVRFVTIYPGWYPGRTVHIHFKIRTEPLARRSFDFTSQLYFDDEVTDRAHAAPPYAERGPRAARNRRDRIFWHGGDQLMLAPSPTADGYAATFSIGLQLP
jgi:protocatechuate 3,4-dioxygenase beta subunit